MKPAEQEWIVIRGVGSVSGIGCTPEEIRQAYLQNKPAFTTLPHLDETTPVSPLSPSAEISLQALLQEESAYATVDRSVQLAILAARQAVAAAGWKSEELEATGINIGSSRGATSLFEQSHTDFLANPLKRLPPATSPSTTLGNVASWVAHDLQASGPVISHSVTCSTALQAIANGLAWLKSGMAKRFIVGGTEAPLTPFTIAQMKALGIYSKYAADNSPCRPLNPEKQNSFVLGEGAAFFALERMTKSEITALPAGSVITVEAVGLGFELSPSKTGITREGLHFQKAMREALRQASLSPSDIDAIVVHAPGTRAGDVAEINAMRSVFGESLPPLFSNKQLIGHTLGASGALSADFAFTLLQQAESLSPLYSSYQNSTITSYSRIIVNAAGFGGNSGCVVLNKLVR
ncbi:beta-ketoacyl synthase N-terminal-like domain-containing protein [Rufibacter roseus]|uniref:Beta-ketoacyl synthase N-terminal-like domain-containing protein n=1 Tax=Rufibacter roseus TaxID=1567108 RepID=A0ABW2DQK4_9BACT|nr:beta-ketoacyl synthase N-terminal-like domain-containing protein [Rufibacter roseus]